MSQKAIVVVGDFGSNNGPGYSNYLRCCATMAYMALKARGYSDTEIRVLAAGTVWPGISFWD